MKKKAKYTVWIILSLAIIAGGYSFLKPKPPVTVYTTAEVVRGDMKQTVSETGTIITVNQTDLSFKVSGRVISLKADVGDPIKTGQLLAELDSGTLESELRKAQYDVQAQAETLQDMRHNKSVYEKDQREAQSAKVRSAKESVGIILTQIRDTKMYSPIDGVILKRNVDPYETTVANSPTPVFTVGNTEDLVIETNVPESDINKIIIGQNADVSFDSLTGEDDVFLAKVVEIDPSSTVIQDVVYYRIKLKLEKNDPRIKSGMTTNIDIHTAEASDVLMIPIRAVQMEGKNKFVQVLIDEKNKVTQRKSVTTGLEGEDGMVEVKSGLNAGEKVVTFTKTQ